MKLIVFYDNWCANCTKFAYFIKRNDRLQLIVFNELRNEEITKKYPSLDIDLATKQIASSRKKIRYGYTSLFLIFLRVPLFWLFIPILFLLKISGIGQIIYIQLAVKRKIIPINCNGDNCTIQLKIK